MPLGVSLPSRLPQEVSLPCASAWPASPPQRTGVAFGPASAGPRSGSLAGRL